MKFTVAINNLLIIVLMLLILIPMGMADENSTVSDDNNKISPDSTEPGLIYNGTLNTKSEVSVKATSGETYSVNGNSPVGILEILRSDGKILNYSFDDSLMKNRGILILDGINGIKPDQDKGWYVKVNGERLEDVILPDIMGLNRYDLKEGDVVLYILGDPRGMISESAARLAVTLGSIQKVTLSNTTDSNVTGESDKENLSNIEEIVENPKEELQDEEIETTTEKEPEEKNNDSGEKSSITSGENIIYNGSFTLPSGNINITTTGGDYEINAATPLGLLQSLLDDDKISTLVISDRSMKKADILILEGINDLLFTGDKTWFVTVNNVILKDYLNPSTEGLNIFKIKSGDEVGYYFGVPSKPIKEADASMIVTLK